MDFAGVSFERAQEFCDHVVAREPFQVQALARWMRADGGPVEAMDASLGSLVPLWEWFVAFVLDGSPTVESGVYPSTYPLPEQWVGKDDAVRRRVVAAQAITHYVRLVASHEDPPAPWTVYVTPPGARVPDADHHETGIRRSDGVVIVPIWVANTAGQVVDRRPHALEPTRLRDHAAMYLRLHGSGGARGSVLVPLLDADLGPVPEAAISPVVRWLREPVEVPASPVRVRRGVGEEMTLARGPAAGLEDPGKFAPLPTGRIVAALAGAGFVGEGGEPVTAADLVDGAELAHRDEVAQVAVLVHDGRVRALHVEPAAGTAAQWDELTARLTGLAADLGAWFRPDADLDE